MANPGFGLRINNARCDRGMSQVDLALALRTAQPNVSRWEREAACPSRLVFDKLARVLGVTSEWLLWGGMEPQATRRPLNRYDPDMATVRLLTQEEAEAAAFSVPGPKRGNPRG